MGIYHKRNEGHDLIISKNNKARERQVTPTKLHNCIAQLYDPTLLLDWIGLFR